MFTILPPPARTSGRSTWVTASWAVRLTSTWRRNSSSDWNSSGPGREMPALLTRPASLPPVALALELDRVFGGSAPVVGRGRRAPVVRVADLLAERQPGEAGQVGAPVEDVVAGQVAGAAVAQAVLAGVDRGGVVGEQVAADA